MTTTTRGLSVFRGGFSLIELLLVLGVLAILMVAAFVLYPRVQKHRAAQEVATEIQASLAKMHTAAGASRRYGWVVPNVSYRFFPDDWIYPNGSNPPTIKPPTPNGRMNFWVYGSDITGNSNAPQQQRSALKLEIYSLGGNAANPPDPDFCIPFITAMAPAFTLITADGGLVLLDKENANAAQRKATLDVDALGKACAESSSGTSPIVRFVGM